MVAPVQPSQKDIAYLRAHPEVAEKFNFKFGPNAATRFLNVTTGTVTNNPADTGEDMLRSGARTGLEMLGGMLGQGASMPDLLSFPINPMALSTAGNRAMNIAGQIPAALGLEEEAAYEPQTIPGKAVYYGAPFLPLAVGGVAAGRPLTGLGSAIAGAGTDAAMTESGLPREMGAIGGTIASMIAGAPLMFRNTGQRLASEAIEGIPEQRISDAVALQRSSVEEGVPLMAPEALNEPGVIALADAAATYPGAAAPFHAVARERENLSRRAIQTKLDQTGSPDLSPTDVASDMTEAGKLIIGGAAQDRTRAAQTAGYSNLPLEHVGPDRVTNLAALVDATLAQTAGMSGLKPLLQKFRGQLFEEDGSPITNAAYLESAYKQLREGLNRRTSGALISPDDAISAEDAGKVGPLIDELADILQEAPSYEPGRSTFESISESTVDPLRAQLEPVIGANDWKQIRTVMLDPDSVTAKELGPLLQTIERKSPSAVPNIARVIFERAYDRAFKQRGGKTPPTSPARFVDALRNNGIQRQKFEEVVSSVARSRGKNPSQVVAGWNKLLDVLQRTATMPDVGSRTNPRGTIQRQAGETLLSQGINLAQPLQVLERATGSRNMRRLGAILADSNGVQGLVDLAQTKPNTARAAYIVNALLQTARVIENAGTEQ